MRALAEGQGMQPRILWLFENEADAGLHRLCCVSVDQFSALRGGEGGGLPGQMAGVHSLHVTDCLLVHVVTICLSVYLFPYIYIYICRRVFVGHC